MAMTATISEITANFIYGSYNSKIFLAFELIEVGPL
jgi:hypothetical protein